MRPFKNVQRPKVGRSVFDLSYSKVFDAVMGKLYPIMCDEVVPGDSFKIGNEAVVRCMPLVAPMLHEVNVYTHYFFVPYRLLWDDWTDFISGGVDGDDASTLPRMSYPVYGTDPWESSLWNYLGFPKLSDPNTHGTDTMPLDFPRRAYSFIYNEYYRDETNIPEIDYISAPSDSLLYRAWTKDYFTSALPWAQRGTAPALPISGSAPLTAAVDGPDITFAFGNLPYNAGYSGYETWIAQSASPDQHIIPNANLASANAAWNGSNPGRVATLDDATVSGTADLSGATTFDVNDLRTAFQIQKWMERNARSGVRYTEFLLGHFGVTIPDSTVQRPIYIGGSKAPLIVSEVLQTSESNNTPQGNMAGHGIAIDKNFCGKFFANEYGLIMGLMSIVPVPMYCQGINRQWLRRSRYDYYFPEFSSLGEQAIERGEIYWSDNDSDNEELFGFQGRYDEMRYKPNQVCGLISPKSGTADFNTWTLCRSFSSYPELNAAFINCNPTPRSWAVTSSPQPQFIVHFGNRIRAVRPLPAMGTPGLIDHH